MGFLIYAVIVIVAITTTVAVIQNTPTSANVNGTPERNPNQNGWYNSPVKISWAGFDNLGNKLTNCEPTPYSGNNGKQIRVSGSCLDKSDTRRYGEYFLNYDTTRPDRPTISAKINNEDFNGGETFVSSIVFTFSSSDSTSGIWKHECSINGAGFFICYSPYRFDATQGGNHELRIKAVDRAGNESFIRSFTWTISTVG